MEDNNYITDLLNAQKEIEGVGKDGKNPFFKSDYTTLNSTILACKEILNNHNFVLLQPIESDENGVYVCTTLLHSSGEKVTSKMRIEQAKINDPQAQGSAITYARRYSLKSLLTMSDGDDDGEKAMARQFVSSVATEAQRDVITNLMRETKVTIEEIRGKLKITEKDKLTKKQAIEVIAWMKGMAE